MLKLGGMENKSPKTEQTPGRFRVARNVMPTPDGTIIPRYDGAYQSVFVSSVNIPSISNYDGNSFEISNDFAGRCKFYRSSVGEIPISDIQNSTAVLGGRSYSQLPITMRVNNTLYMLTPSNGHFLKYDGVQVSPAGLGASTFITNGYLSTGTTRFVRFVKHTIDFDNNEPVSDFIQFPANPATPSFIVNTAPFGPLPVGYVSLPSATLVNTSPANYYPVPTDFPRNNFVGTAVYDAVNSQLDITQTFPQTRPLNRESYVMVFHTQAQMTAAAFGSNARALALKVKSSSPLVLDLNNAKVLGEDRVWTTQNLTTGAIIAPLITYGANHYLTMWESVAATGIYYYRTCIPYLPNSSPSGIPTNIAPWAQTVTTTGLAVASTGSDSLAFTIGPTLNGWYDTTTIKISANSTFNFGETNFTSMTKYQSLILLANNNYIWFSDTSLGGWVEQFNSQNSLLVGDKEYGRITAICAAEDFFIVSRERKNYYVSGNITTGNYSVQDIENIPVGAWCNNSAINVKNTVFLLTAKGLYQIGAGGSASSLGDMIPRNFNSFNFINLDEDVVFEMKGTTSNLSFDGLAKGISSSYDPFRELLVFMQRSQTNPCLVIDTAKGEIYEWNGMDATVTDVYAECISFIDTRFYLGEVDNRVGSFFPASRVFKETPSLTRTYAPLFPIKLYTTWTTSGEPSLEKELLQLKMFGKVAVTGANSLKVRHYKDWNIQTLITDTTYVPQVLGNINTQVQFSHKKRLNSDKCLAASIGIEIQDSTTDFEIESFEIEFNPIQAGVKR